MNVLRKALFLFLLALFFVFIKREREVIHSQSSVLFQEDEFSLIRSSRVLKDKAHFYRMYSPSEEYLKSSDAIILGNSRPLMGLSHDQITEFEQKGRFKVFNLSFAFSDNINFGTFLLDELKCYPKYIVVHVGPFIFSKNFSPQAFNVISKGRWNNSLDYQDFLIASQLKKTINIYLGRSIFANKSPYIYRSKKSGCIKPIHNLKSIEFLYEAFSSPLRSEYLKCVFEFVKWAKKRSIQPILFQVPAPGLDASHVSILGKYFDLPYIESPCGMYSSYDYSHLTKECAEKFTRNFLNELKNLIHAQTDF